MTPPTEWLEYYERLSSLVIFEGLSAISFVFFFFLKATGVAPSFEELVLLVAVYLQLPAVRFAADYFSRRKDKVKKFFISLGLIALGIVLLIVIVVGLIYQTLSTIVGLAIAVATIWLTYKPPMWLRDILNNPKK